MNASPPSRQTRVLIVDDSAVIRAILRRTLEQDDSISVVGTVTNGQEAVNAVNTLEVDIVVLDIEMPIMDGLTALPLIRQARPQALVLICSTLSERGADISLRALSLGAADCILKPGGESITSAQDFKNNLLRVIQGLSVGRHKTQNKDTGNILRAPCVRAPEVIAIASSTGGPKALEEVLKNLRGSRVPIVITQHMPKSFTTLLAQNLGQSCGIPCVEAADDMKLNPGCAYIAPGGFHMEFMRSGLNVLVRLSDAPPENYCKPSADPMLRSLVKAYENRVRVAVLTGMGADGLEGCRQVIEAGGEVIAQDAETSIVWGMPGAVAMAGLCSAILPLPEIAGYLGRGLIPERKIV